MSPNGRSVGTGRYPYFTARIRPFYDSDEEREILFYQTDPLAEGVRTCFGTTWWLARECHYWPAVGTVIGSEQALPGASHPMTVGDPIGRPEWFTEGISRAALLRGDYGPGAPRCDPFPPEMEVSRAVVEVIRAAGNGPMQVGRTVVEVVGDPP
jgi:hypothetical protein